MHPGFIITPSSVCFPCLNTPTIRPHICIDGLSPSVLTLQPFPWHCSFYIALHTFSKTPGC